MKTWLKITVSTNRVRLFLFLLVFVLYGNTLRNEFALDDSIVLTENTEVQGGIQNWPEFFRQDYMAGDRNGYSFLSSTRYRPLTLIYFSIFFHVFGLHPFMWHLFNLIAYALLIDVLFRLILALPLYRFFSELKQVDNWIPAGLCSLFFLTYPMHSEVVANVKGMDDLLVGITGFYSIFWAIEKEKKHTKGKSLVAVILFATALFLKESAIVFGPLLFFIFKGLYPNSFRQSTKKIIPYVFVVVGYLIVRSTMVGWHREVNPDPSNDPFLGLGMYDAFAFKCQLVWRELFTMIAPYYFSIDYGYNQIQALPSLSLTSVGLEALLMICIASTLSGVYKNRSWALFPFLWGLLYWPFSNFIFSTGAPIADRFLFLPALSYSLLFAVVFVRINQLTKRTLNLAVRLGYVLVPIVIFSGLTVARNFDWKDNKTLILHDVGICKYSARLNLFAGEQELLIAKSNPKLSPEIHNRNGLRYCLIADSILPHRGYILERVGLAYYYNHQLLQAAHSWIQTKIIMGRSPQLDYLMSQLADIIKEQAQQPGLNILQSAYLRSVADSLRYP